MKLCYIWVEKYKNLEDFELNLCSNTQYCYDHDIATISETEKHSVPKNLFNEKFSDITAIVGKNSAGKSNSLDLICKILVNNIKSFKNYIFIMEDNNTRYIYSSLIPDREIINKTKCEINNSPSSIKNLNVVFFSNIYDANYLPISTFNSRNNFKFISANNNYNLRSYHRSTKHTTLFKKQISFIKNLGRKNLEEIDFDVPDNIMVGLVFKPVNEIFRFYSNVDKNNSTYIKEFDKYILSKLRKIIDRKDISSLDKYIECLKISIVHRVIDRYVKFNKNDIDSFDVKFENVIEIIENKKFNKIIDYNKKWNDDLEDDKELENTLTQIDSLKESISDNVDISSMSEFNPRHIEFRIKFKTSDNLSSHLYEHLENMISLGFISVRWEGISSGHNAFLTLFSLIYDALKGTRANTIICIDEGDLYLHPKWQIQFFRNIEKILPQFSSSSSQKLQLVLTSHSPFLLTDLPRNNIIILNEGKVVDNDLKTFGANLYDLYDQAFFLDQEKIGTFAFSKIIEASENIYSSNKDLKNNAKLLIDIIGDDLIRGQLKGMINND
ncbi:AAA family ATPase [Vibrio parahaemolyticus]|uniref:AAA family ATPase n=1 Tax=Vibrio parahaemolyticus TaxID=670 RepID=UPI0023610C5A|nr:AAA family ATPase [Vibrio parahaemolyticus]